MYSTARDNEAEELNGWLLSGLLYLQVLMPRQFAYVGQSVNMEWGVKENRLAATALHKCGKSHSQIFEV